MRPVLFVPGVIVVLMGLVWALQGAGYLPTTFMVGPPWILIGAGVASLGVGVAAMGALKK